MSLLHWLQGCVTPDRGHGFVIYHGQGLGEARSLAGSLDELRYDATLYDPDSRREDPVSNITDSIDSADVDVCLRQKRESTDWTMAELNWADAKQKIWTFEQLVPAGEESDREVEAVRAGQ